MAFVRDLKVYLASTSQARARSTRIFNVGTEFDSEYVSFLSELLTSALALVYGLWALRMSILAPESSVLI